jgi:SAM-dependent methyltransferase
VRIKKNSSNRQTGEKIEYAGTSELLENEESLKNYSWHIINLVTQSISPKSQPNTLEFGAGTGFLMQIFEEKTGYKPKGIEIDPKLVKIIKDKGYNCFSGTNEIQEKFELIFTSNVLEHIEDDVTALREIKTLLTQDGILAIYVPALPILFSQLDHNVGHFRRYRKRELKSKLLASGYEVESIRYVDSLGVLAALLTKVIGYKNQAGLGSRKSLIIYDKAVFPISKILDQMLMKNVLGKNLFVRARPIPACKQL